MSAKIGKNYNLRLYNEDWQAFFDYCDRLKIKPVNKIHELILFCIGKTNYTKPVLGRPKKVKLERVLDPWPEENIFLPEATVVTQEQDWYEEMFA